MLPLQSSQMIDRIIREDWGRILSALTGHFGDLSLAEDALQDAIEAALQSWPEAGLPKTPAAWLLSVARRRAVDRLRRKATARDKASELSYLESLNEKTAPSDMDAIPDKRLEMIFTCCHPALDDSVKVPLTLRTLGGLSTEDIAKAFLLKPQTLAQRLVRAKHKIKAAGIPFMVPDKSHMPERLTAVLKTIYLIFNEGYHASRGAHLIRYDLSAEAIRLARIISGLMPDEPEVQGLLALMLLHDARRHARTGADGDMIVLEHQMRTRWDKSKIKEGDRILKAAMKLRRIGPYQLQAAISALHCHAISWDDTDWAQISGLYGLLYQMQPSPVIAINRAVAVSYADNPEAALDILDALNGLEIYQPYHAARADILERLGRHAGAKTSYARAIELSDNDRERAFLRDKAARFNDPNPAPWVQNPENRADKT